MTVQEPRLQVAENPDAQVNLDLHAWKENRRNMQAACGLICENETPAAAHDSATCT